MTIRSAVNYTVAGVAGLKWPDNDLDEYDRQTQLAAITINLEAHDHSDDGTPTGKKGLPVQRVGIRVVAQAQSFIWAMGSVP